ncbi:sigma-70 family RNA polymerase sigma factor [Nonomuraea phyllanthi]|uniref:RNA polymerase sigma factor n=1 Tax=Nonomuraea phyllanthi TaxID=2219224 RepID=A0A5C4WW98_9ACTN|nr:sigma-70 family RNA polymerase sigma factor [Nonomuraea phyllanthi]KAB8197453.1 sigma-70 family RNA polymerase sigma factor [Nonomuraea phyllanthi]
MASGDAQAAAALVRRYQARVFGLARAIVREPGLAEEVAQEAFVRAWRHAAAYDSRRGAVSTWLLAITRNLAIDALRLRREEPVDPQVLLTRLLAVEPADEAAQAAQGEEFVRQALRGLPLEQARAIALAVFYGMSGRKIAEIEGIPLGTAKTRLRRGMARLRDQLEVSDG